ncbi:hypothetical protein NDU88_002038 [Pleurodeles waltl]|uniref:Uncharacterized protein n=1 Tax=Pleurodeles waltl TaxID=8319 RepID=A0AAV7P770_PLEWA|nr:hypothetical protein NDU88_002038 [Pleurodeles waltl]
MQWCLPALGLRVRGSRHRCLQAQGKLDSVFPCYGSIIQQSTGQQKTRVHGCGNAVALIIASVMYGREWASAPPGTRKTELYGSPL